MIIEYLILAFAFFWTTTIGILLIMEQGQEDKK